MRKNGRKISAFHVLVFRPYSDMMNPESLYDGPVSCNIAGELSGQMR